jgi:putative tricarboxylic transport membrane protein
MTLKVFKEKNLGGLFAIIFGFLSLHEASKLYPYSHDLLTGDHTFPGVIGFLLVLFGLSLFFERKSEAEKVELPIGKTRFVLISSILILFIYCFLITFVGYIISTLVVSIFLIKIIGNYRWVFATITGGIVTIVLYFLFIILLKTPFPIGIFA